MSFQPIENYGVIGNMQSTALIGMDGSMDFLCYVWRLSSITKLEESDGGVYVEVEALGLSRSIPIMLRWLIDPILEQLPRNSMNAALEETRKAVLANLGIDD